jgi:hypothetical protein
MDRVDYQSLIISDLLGYHSAKTLDINPWYQRRSVWQTSQKSYLINTIFEQKPVPSIYIRQQIDLDNERSIKEVVDGQQRIRTIISYRNDEFGAKHPAHRGRVRYSGLTNPQKTAFLSTALSVGFLIGATDQDVIEIFGRINSVSKTLNPMEKLNALHSGEFKQFCLNQAVSRLPFWRQTGLFTANDIARMIEVQFVSDLAINLIEGLIDYSPKKIANYYQRYDEEFALEEDITRRFDLIFSKLASIPASDFSDTIFRSAQNAFSLMLVIDSMREAAPDSAKIRNVMRDIDAAVTAASDEDGEGAFDLRFITGFAGGNLHRIRARSMRDEVLREALA